MSRETKEQSIAHEAVENVVRLTTYPDRLMSMLRRATQANYELGVSVDHTFTLVDRDDRYNKFKLAVQFDENSDLSLQELDWTLEVKEKQAREQERQRQIRQNALAKLTDEERKFLNL